MASSRPVSPVRSARVPTAPVTGSALRQRTALGIAVTLGGVIWIALGLSSLVWFGPTPIGLYRSLDQPPILLCLVGLWYTARGLIGRDDDWPADREDGP